MLVIDTSLMSDEELYSDIHILEQSITIQNTAFLLGDYSGLGLPQYLNPKMTRLEELYEEYESRHKYDDWM